MEQFVTLSKSDPKYMDYLLGRFSVKARALPVASLNTQAGTALRTFHIVDKSAIKTPGFILRWAQICKLRYLVLPCLNMFLILVLAAVEGGAWNTLNAMYSLFAVSCILVAVNLRNDCNDHISGLDAMLEDNAVRPLQKGWATAVQLLRVSNLLLLAGGVLAALVLWSSSYPLWVFVAVCLVGFGFLHSQKIALRFRQILEMGVFLFMGPLLSIGLQWAIGLEFNMQILYVGILVGLLSVYLLHLKNFFAVLVTKQLHITNSVSWLGFERAKKLMWYWWILICFMLTCYQFIYSSLLWTLCFAFCGAALSIPVRRSITLMQSPLGSPLKPALRNLRTLTLLLFAVWVVEGLAQLLLLELHG